MSDESRPEKALDPNAAENGSGTPTSPETDAADEVQGYMMIVCSACMHQHRQTDPKCNLQCMHGSSFTGMPGTIPTTY